MNINMNIWRSALPALLLAILLFGGCEQPSVSFSPTFTMDFDVDEPTQTNFVKETLLDADEENSDLNKYRKNIKSVDIQRVTYYLPNFTGGPGQTLTNGEIKIINPSTNAEATLATLTNVNLMSVAAKETELTTSDAAEKMLADLLKNDPHEAKVRLTGTVNEAPIKLKVRLTVYSKVEAKAL